MPLTSAVGRAPTRSRVLKPASPASARDFVTSRNSASSKGTFANRSRSVGRQFEHVVVEAGTCTRPSSSCRAAASRAIAVAGFGIAPPNTPECRSRSGPWKSTVASDQAAHAGDRARHVGRDHAGVGDHDDVAVEALTVLDQQVGEVRRARLLLALDQELQIDGRRGAAGRVQVGPQPEQVEQQLTLVVGRAPRPQHVAVDRRLERRVLPQLDRVDRLHVVVAVHQDGRRVGVAAGPLGIDRRQARRSARSRRSGSRPRGRPGRTSARWLGRRRGARAGR